jgi:hypothetical protein
MVPEEPVMTCLRLNTTTDEERRKLMAEHMKSMQDSMARMGCLTQAPVQPMPEGTPTPGHSHQ